MRPRRAPAIVPPVPAPELGGRHALACPELAVEADVEAGPGDVGVAGDRRSQARSSRMPCRWRRTLVAVLRSKAREKPLGAARSGVGRCCARASGRGAGASCSGDSSETNSPSRRGPVMAGMPRRIGRAAVPVAVWDSRARSAAFGLAGRDAQLRERPDAAGGEGVGDLQHRLVRPELADVAADERAPAGRGDQVDLVFGMGVPAHGRVGQAGRPDREAGSRPDIHQLHRGRRGHRRGPAMRCGPSEWATCRGRRDPDVLAHPDFPHGRARRTPGPRRHGDPRRSAWDGPLHYRRVVSTISTDPVVADGATASRCSGAMPPDGATRSHRVATGRSTGSGIITPWSAATASACR